MKTSIYFYTGTGNSLWSARKIAGYLDQPELVPIARQSKQALTCRSECVGLVFPVHIWGVPRPVTEFVGRLNADSARYIFALAVNAGQVAATLLQLQEILKTKNLELSSGFSIDLPSNYIPWGGAPSKDKQDKKFTAALEKFERISAVVRKREKLPLERGFALQNMILSLIYRKSLPRVPLMDKSFFADEKCNACGICAKICPARNICIVGKKPEWQHRCEQCFACLQWCPEGAIQYGKGTYNKKRYHHPEISLKDVLACAPVQNV